MRVKFTQTIHVDVIDEMALLGHNLTKAAASRHKKKLLKALDHMIENDLSHYSSDENGITMTVSLHNDVRRF